MIILSESICSKVNNRFVVHEHRAIRAGLHHDIRLGKDCVLKSWATRKLPDLIDNKTKRIMLFPTPDHSPDWIDFSGEITDKYGKGQVSIWDSGSYKIIKWDDDGKKIINFKGSKIQGNFAIIPYKEKYLMLRMKSGEKK